jgi:hypothetical protein
MIDPGVTFVNASCGPDALATSFFTAYREKIPFADGVLQRHRLLESSL